jgi:hypothetical protein
MPNGRSLCCLPVVRASVALDETTSDLACSWSCLPLKRQKTPGATWDPSAPSKLLTAASCRHKTAVEMSASLLTEEYIMQLSRLAVYPTEAEFVNVQFR